MTLLIIYIVLSMLIGINATMAFANEETKSGDNIPWWTKILVWLFFTVTWPYFLARVIWNSISKP